MSFCFILLILSLLFFILISCKNPDSVINKESNSEETETAAETEPAYYQTLENDFGGQAFRILGVVNKNYDLPYIDFAQPYWNEEVNNSISIDGRLYFTVSDFSFEDKN